MDTAIKVTQVSAELQSVSGKTLPDKMTVLDSEVIPLDIDEPT
jgi:hypothetical protein